MEEDHDNDHDHDEDAGHQDIHMQLNAKTDEVSDSCLDY